MRPPWSRPSPRERPVPEPARAGAPAAPPGGAGAQAAAPKVAFKTLGCRLNQAESEKALEALGSRGFDLAHAGEEPDVMVINTCTVTRESTASSRRLIRRMAEEHPRATVVVTGCYAVSNPEEVQAIPGVDLVVSNDAKDRIADLIAAAPAVRRLPLTVRPASSVERLRT